MISKIMGSVVFLMLLVVLSFFGRAIYQDFRVYYDRQWGAAVIEDITGEKMKKDATGKDRIDFSSRTYKIRFRDEVKKISIIESIDFKKGDPIRVVYSPCCPRNFKLKIPSIVWISVWAVFFLVAAPGIVYYSVVFLKDFLREGT